MTQLVSCPACNKEYSINATACIDCGEPNTSAPIPKAQLKWYHRKGNVIPLLLLLFPVGVYAMWKGEHFPGWVRWTITAILVLAVIGSLTNPANAQDLIWFN